MFIKILSVLIACVILYKLIPLLMGMDGVTLLFTVIFSGVACFAIHLFFRILNAGTTFRR
jgi:hypothetical protein